MDIKGINFTQLCASADKFNCYLWRVDFSEGKALNTYSNSIEYLTGYPITEIEALPKGLISLIAEEDRQKRKVKFTNIADDPSVENADLIYRLITKEDKPVWIKEKLHIIRDEQGKITTTLSMLFDINDVKSETIELKEEIKKLTDMNSIKDKFISIVSHDLRSPFTTLLGFTEILINEDDLPVEERDEYLSYIYDASKSQLQMINYLVDWSRLQTGRTKIEPCRLNVRDVISNCVSALTGTAVRKNIEIKTFVPVELYINADERLMSQAITNLLTNAIKYSESGKKIQITANKFKEGRIEIVVKDEGIGIPEEHQPKLFKIDFKYCIPGTKGEKGTGLGLALVKEIIEKHEGDIWFYSAVAEGSEFHVTIPEAKNIIMIVEEDAERRKAVKECIIKEYPAFEILEAENGYKAINTALNKIPSLMIINHDMPLMDGIQFVETVKNKSTLKNIPVIVITDNIDDEVLKKYSDLKIEKVIGKTNNIKILTRLIKENVV